MRAFEKVAALHKVFAGTINGPGAIEVMVARASTESTMARVVKLVTEAQTQRSPTQNFTDKFERIFVPVILIGVVLLLFAGFVIDEPFSTTFYRAMAVLVAASPCALAISVPSAVLSGVARAGRSGVLVKGGGPLENLGTLTAIAFDKTGTLTEGRPRVTDIVPANGVSKEQLLETAAAVEALSDHPLAAAVVTAAKETLPVAPGRAQDVESITGHGVRGRFRDQDVYIGKLKLFETIPGAPVPEAVRADSERLATSGRTVMIVRAGETYLGVLGLLDTPREGAAEVISALRSLGLKRLVMLSGDNQGVADAIALKLGLTEARGGLMPEDKVDFIKAMRDQEGRVAMVGDGVNDAAALAASDLGIAMGSGTDAAKEAAGITLMRGDLVLAVDAIRLSRRTLRTIRTNLFWAFAYNVAAIPLAALGMLTPMIAGAAMAFSSVFVVANSLLLRGFRPESR